ncbi:hypothetical protein ACNSOO_04735 [Aliarcobacter lanthieri]|uniref:hypothetical protein n=1 Tax=Aliarcobacter lanthieri TaxID=1355374 RepID=UPI003AAC29EE
MKTITGNIKLLTNEDFENKTILFTLCNHYGKELNSIDINYKFPIKISTKTDDEGFFSIDLYEIEKSDIKMFYKMTFPDNPNISEIKLFVQEGVDEVDFLKLLFPTQKLEMFYENKNQKIIFDDYVLELFERFFVNENLFVNRDENNLLQEFIKYADEKRNSELMEKLDKYLGSIK